MKITSLLENTASRADVCAEHGLSLYIETERHRILFDMGQSDLFAKNAQALGVDLSRVDLAVLSHGHYDHGGGLKTFLSVNTHAPVYVHRDAFLPHYNGTEKYIGLDTALAKSPRLVFTDDSHRIDDTLSLFSCNGEKRGWEKDSGGLFERVESDFIPDDFRHEQYLLIEDAGRRVLISGCSHAGILNITAHFAPDVLVGGFHLSKMPTDERLASMAMALAAYPTAFYTCHCTGQAQYDLLRSYMPRLSYLACGDSISL